MKIREWEWALLVLVVIGALNRGLVGTFQFDLLKLAFDTAPNLTRVIDVVIGMAGTYWLYKLIVTKK